MGAGRGSDHELVVYQVGKVFSYRKLGLCGVRRFVRCLVREIEVVLDEGGLEEFLAVIIGGMRLYKIGASGLPLLGRGRGRRLFHEVHRKSGLTQRRCVGKGLQLILDIVGQFSDDGRGTSSLFRVKYIKLMGTMSGFSPSHRIGFSACTIPVVVKRVHQCLQSGDSLHIDHSLHSVTCGMVCAERNCVQGGVGRPDVRRVTRRVKLSGRRMICTLSTMRAPVDLRRPICGSNNSTLCIVSRIDSGGGERRG